MRKMVSCVLSICLSAGVALAQQPSLLIDHWETKNHVPVYFVVRNEVPMVDVAVAFAAGSSRDAKAWGLATLTASLLGEGTSRNDAADIAAGFDAVGARFSASASRDIASVSLRSMTDSHYFSAAVDLYLDVLTQPDFAERAFKRVKQQLLDALNRGLENPAAVASNQLYRTIYGEHPYGHPVLGEPQTVAALGRDDVIAFYHRYYVSNNASIIMVGDLSKKAAIRLAEKIAQALPPGERPAPLPVAQQATKLRNQWLPMPVSQDTITLGALGLDYNAPNYVDLVVANHILGGASLTSLLMQEIRDKYGYTYGVYSVFSRLQAKGIFELTLKVRAAKSQQAQQLARQTLKKYRQQGPTQQQLDEAKANLQASFPAKLASNSSVLSNVIVIAMMGLPLDYLQQYQQRIAAVTRDSAKTAFAKAVDLSALNTVVVGEKAMSDAHEKK